MSGSDLGEAVVTTAPSPSEPGGSSGGGSGGTLTSLTSANPGDWRPYTFEHPLTAATTAMLNISGGSEDSATGFGILYDYHYGSGKLGSSPDHGKLPDKTTLSADIWSPIVVTNIGNGPNKLGTNGDLPVEVYSSLHQSSTKITSVLRRAEPAAKIPKLSHNGHSRYMNGDGSHHHSPTHGSGGGVIIIKDEAHSPGSPRSSIINGGTTPGGILISNPPTPLAPTSVSPTDHQSDQYHSPQLFATLSTHPSGTYDFVGPPGNISSFPPSTSLRGGPPSSSGVYPIGTSPSEPYYRVDFFSNEFGASGVTTASRQLSPYDGGTDGPASFVDRYVVRQSIYKHPHGNHLPVDLPSPDSGIGTEVITPRDPSTLQQGFDYADLCHPGLIAEIPGTESNARSSSPSAQQPQQQKSSRPWHDFGRQNEADKIQIPKLFCNYGFRYYLESPISTSQRREDDRITYINKGQFYGITLEYVPDSEKPIKSQTVKSVVMLVFREEKSPEDEIKAWQFWHGRQHSLKQRILDADTKNSVGLMSSIEEVAHNAIAVYWNPMESSAKINVAVQCLSTDFSSQKGVKGLPLHLQIDTYDDLRDPNCPISQRGYCQIKVFCDKGAERKTRDEERRATKRKLSSSGRKKMDELYHTSLDRSEFYSMSDLQKPPVLFSPAEEIDKLTSLELHGFYGGGGNSEGSDHSGGPSGHHHASSGSSDPDPTPSHLRPLMMGDGGSPQHHPHLHLIHHHHHHGGGPPLKFHHNFPPDSPPPTYIRHTADLSPQPPPSQPVSVISNHISNFPPSSSDDKTKDLIDTTPPNGVLSPTNSDSHHHDPSVLFGSSSILGTKRSRLLPPSSERLMIYVRQDGEDAFTPLHLVPPSRDGLLRALEEKYKISMGSVNNLYRRNSKGILAKIDDEMLRHYFHEDSFLLDILPLENDDAFDVTLTEILISLQQES